MPKPTVSRKLALAYLLINGDLDDDTAYLISNDAEEGVVNSGTPQQLVAREAAKGKQVRVLKITNRRFSSDNLRLLRQLLAVEYKPGYSFREQLDEIITQAYRAGVSIGEHRDRQKIMARE